MRTSVTSQTSPQDHFLAKVCAKLEVVSRILRHASVGTTAGIYRHINAGELHEAVERFAPFSQPSPGLPPGELDGKRRG